LGVRFFLWVNSGFCLYFCLFLSCLGNRRLIGASEEGADVRKMLFDRLQLSSVLIQNALPRGALRAFAALSG
jgi:hypothetical protein